MLFVPKKARPLLTVVFSGVLLADMRVNQPAQRNWEVVFANEYTRTRVLWPGYGCDYYTPCDCSCGGKLALINPDASYEDDRWRNCTTYSCVLCGDDPELHDDVCTEVEVWAAVAETMFRKTND